MLLGLGCFVVFRFCLVLILGCFCGFVVCLFDCYLTMSRFLCWYVAGLCFGFGGCLLCGGLCSMLFCGFCLFVGFGSLGLFGVFGYFGRFG